MENRNASKYLHAFILCYMIVAEQNIHYIDGGAAT